MDTQGVEDWNRSGNMKEEKRKKKRQKKTKMTIRKEIGNKRGARESSKSKKEEADEGQKMGVNILMFLHPLRSRRG